MKTWEQSSGAIVPMQLVRPDYSSPGRSVSRLQGPRGSVTGRCGCREMDGSQSLEHSLPASPAPYAHPVLAFLLRCCYYLLFPSGDFQLHKAMNHSFHESQFLNMWKGGGIN